MTISYSESLVSSPAGVQGSYPQNLTRGHEGMLGDLQAYVSRSYMNETGAVIPFGHAVLANASGVADQSAKLPAGASASGVIGIALDSNTFKAEATADGRKGYPGSQAMNIASKGVVYVFSKDAIAVGDAVRLYHTDGVSASSTGAYAGRFGKTAAAGKTFEVTAGARWLSSCAAGGIALLEIDIPGVAVNADT